jgi:non-canonical (house-cleaning) NTP pyrophosphatase
MLKIALGTTSKYKIAYVKDVLTSLGIEATIKSVDTDSGVTSQPRNEKETLQGSINRAKAALTKVPTADIGLGIEIGYEPLSGNFYMHGWSSIVDSIGNIYSEQSSTLELPKFFYQYLHDHDSDGVGQHVQEYKDKLDDTTWKEFAEIIQYRKPFITESSRNVLLHYYHRREY